VFRELGFRRISDRVEATDPATKTGWKRSLLQAGHKSGVIKALMLTFMEVTTFVCVK
jgi:hypothetical protein